MSLVVPETPTEPVEREAGRGGPTLYVEPSAALPLVSIAIALRSGSATDPPGQEGLTRTMVRMLRRGSRGLSSHEVEERIDALGAELSADVSPSVITLQADVISRSLEPLVELLATIMAEPAFDEVELGKLLRESEGELVELRDNDRGLATRHFRRLLFGSHPYGRRSGGTQASLRAIGRADVVSHYQRHFTSGNLSIALAGDVGEDRAARLAARLASGLRPGAALAGDIPAPARQSGRRLVFVDKPERTQTQILIGDLGSHPRDADHIPLHVATTIFGGTFTSRMMRAIRSERGWSYGAYARLPYDRERDAFSMWTFPAAHDAAACIGLELELLEAWRERGVSARELAFAKRYLVRSHAFDVDTPQKRVHQRLDVDLFDLPGDYHERYVEHVRGVTIEQVNEAVQRRIHGDDLVLSVVGTHAEIGAAVARAVPGLREIQVVPYDAD